MTFAAASGHFEASVEMRYEDENMWLTQKMMAALYDVSVRTINQHLKRLFSDNELDPEATVKKYFIVHTEGSRQVERSVEHYDALITAETQKHEALKPHKKRPDAAAFPSLEEE